MDENYPLSFSSIRERLSSIDKLQSTSTSTSTPTPTAIPRLNKRKTVVPLPVQSHQSSYKTPMKASTRNLKDSSVNHESTKSVRKKRSTNKVQTQVEFQTILRMRPLSEEEDGDKVMISIPDGDGNNTVHLHALKDKSISTPRSHRRALDSTCSAARRMEFHFDTIVGSDSTQEEMYDQIGGLEMASDAIGPMLVGSGDETRVSSELEAKNHVVISMGVSNSGKTFTLFGDEQRREENEGILPRLIDDVFKVENDKGMHRLLLQSASNHSHTSTGTSINPSMIQMEVEISMVHIHNDRISDMLSSYAADRSNRRNSNVFKMINSFETSSGSAKSMQELKISQDKITQDFIVKPNVIRCASSIKAREVINAGMEQNTISSTKLNKRSSRGHTLITLRPVLNLGGGRIMPGASITVIDMAGIERTKSNEMNRIAMRESAAINSSISTVLQCLRSIKNNQEISDHDIENKPPNARDSSSGSARKRKTQLVPYRQNKLTMLMQPLFSGNLASTNVKILVSVYPGMKDYNEKKSLLSDIDSLRGLSVAGTCTLQDDLIEDGLFIASSDSTRNESLPSQESRGDSSIYINPVATTDKMSTVRERGNTSLSSKATELHSPERIVIQRKNDEKDTSLASNVLLKKSPMQKIANVVKPFSSKKRKAETEALQERIQALEAENEALRASHHRAKKRCISLTNDNKSLRRLLDEAEQREQLSRTDAEKNQKTDPLVEEKALREAREWRWRKHQNLLGSPLSRHMQAVEVTRTIFTGRVGTQLTNRSPFKLTALTKRKKQDTPPEQEQDNDDDDELDSLGCQSFSA